MKISNDMLVQAVEKAEAGVQLRRQREYQLWAKSKWFIYECCLCNAGTTDYTNKCTYNQYKITL